MNGMTTCKICGKDFPLIAEEHYVARDIEKKGIIPAFSGQEEAIQYDAFDCPHCGCQNIMQERKITFKETDFIECEDEESDPECDEPEPDKEEKAEPSDAEMRKYLSDYCHRHPHCDCPLDGANFKCGKGYSFSSPVDSIGYMTPEEIKEHYDALMEAIKNDHSEI